MPHSTITLIELPINKTKHGFYIWIRWKKYIAGNSKGCGKLLERLPQVNGIKTNV
jgi:hypothetical protein